MAALSFSRRNTRSKDLVTLRVGAGGAGRGEIVDADQLVVALAGIDATGRALAKIGAIAFRVLVDISVVRADGGKRRAFPVDAGIDIAD